MGAKSLPHRVREVLRPVRLVFECLPVPCYLVVEGYWRAAVVIVCIFGVQNPVAYCFAYLAGDQEVDLTVARTIGNGDACDSRKVHFGKPPPECLGKAIPLGVRCVLNLPEHEIKQVFSLKHNYSLLVFVALTCSLVSETRGRHTYR